MNDISKYIPRHKDDVRRIKELSKTEYPFYKPILSDLFKWIQDINWPVAREIVPLLITAGEDVVPHVKLILNSSDAIWKRWTLSYVMEAMSSKVIGQIKSELERIVQYPSNDEVAEEVDVLAKQLLEKI